MSTATSKYSEPRPVAFSKTTPPEWLLKDGPCFVILGRPKGVNSSDSYVSYCEFSWSLRWSPLGVHLYWTSKNATSNFGGKFEIDGRANAEKDLAKLRAANPELTIEMYDVTDPMLPVIIDWGAYEWAGKYEKGWIYPRDKFVARNPPFKAKD